MDNYKKSILKNLQNISLNKQIFFIALSCEHVLPNYLSYKDEKNSKLLDETIVFFYQCMNKMEYDIVVAQELYDNLDYIIPNLDDDENTLASYGFDCCVLFGEALLYIINRDFNHLENISTTLFDTVDMFIQEKENFDGDTNDLDDKINSDFFMQQEINRQIQVLEMIENNTISNDFITKIREFNNSTLLCDFSYL